MSGVSISAIIAVFNPDPVFFRKAVSSVLGQSLPVLELVLVNDGGSDEFRSVLPDNERIRVFTKPNEGVAATRNFAIDQCRGEYIAFLDQDDFWYPDKIAEQVGMIPVTGGEPCMVVSPVDIVDNNGGVVTKKNQTRVATSYYRKTHVRDFLLALAEGNFIFSSSPLIHRLVFELVGLFDPHTQPHDDWDMYLRIAFAGIPVYCYQARPLSVWRLHDSNESRKALAMLQSKCRVEKKLLGVAHDKKLRAILTTNLLIDYVGRDNLLFKKGQYRRYRLLLRHHLLQLLRDRGNYRGDMAALYQDFSQRVRKTMLKAARRYAVSFFLK